MDVWAPWTHGHHGRVGTTDVWAPWTHGHHGRMGTMDVWAPWTCESRRAWPPAPCGAPRAPACARRHAVRVAAPDAMAPGGWVICWAGHAALGSAQSGVSWGCAVALLCSMAMGLRPAMYGCAPGCPERRARAVAKRMRARVCLHSWQLCARIHVFSLLGVCQCVQSRRVRASVVADRNLRSPVCLHGGLYTTKYLYCVQGRLFLGCVPASPSVHAFVVFIY